MILLEKDFKEQFYNSVIRSENVVVISHFDVDSLCASLIFTSLLDADEIIYTVHAIRAWSELKILIDEYSELSKPPTHFVLINCGGYRSFLELKIENSKKFSIFIVDSKRPYHLDNVYNADGIHILCLDSEINELNVPEFSQIADPNYQSDASDSESDEEEDENRRAPDSIGTRIERRLLKRKRITAYRQNRDRLIYEYNRYTYTSIPSSVFLLKLAHTMGKSSAGLTWCAAVGLASVHVEQAISNQTYSAICLEHMKPFIRRFGPRDRNRIDPTFRISFDRELQLPLYRHWTLNEAVFHDVFFIRRCRLWTHGGKDKIKHVYASLGIPLQECSESYDRLSTERRREVFEIVEGYMKSQFFAFFSHLGFARMFSSADVARVLALILQQPPTQQSAPDEVVHQECFWRGFQLLKYYILQNGGATKEMDDAIHRYKGALNALTTLVFDSVQQKRFLNTPTFIVLTIQTGKFGEVDYLHSLHCMHLFVHLALKVFNGTSNSEQRLKKPLFVAVMNRQVDGVRWYTCSGCMSMADLLGDPERRSFIPQLFDKVAQDKTLYLLHDQIDSNVIIVREDSYGPFFSRIEAELS